MISECFNPSCRKKMNYLREGRVVRAVQEKGNKVQIEHFWLCGECNQTHDMKVQPNGTVTLTAYSPSLAIAPMRVMRRHQRMEAIA
jgi:hypothetical protein